MVVDSISGCLRHINVCPLCALSHTPRAACAAVGIGDGKPRAAPNNCWSCTVQRSDRRSRHRDRLFWVSLSHLWRDWRSILVIVKPETVIKWHQQGFKCYWRWKSRSGRVGRPKIDQEIRVLIRRMSRENSTWGVPSDGEDYNFGLVDINDRPYEELTATASALSTESIQERARLPARATGSVVSVPGANTEAERELLHWNKARSFIANTSSDPAGWRFADAYACWNPRYLYLAVCAEDFVDPLFYNTVLLKLPAAMFGKKRLRMGDSLSLSATLSSHSRAERMEWQKVLRLTK